jgi:hypothetical protein
VSLRDEDFVRFALRLFLAAPALLLLPRLAVHLLLGLLFGAPSHRLEAQMQATARVLEINCQVIYIPGVMLISLLLTLEDRRDVLRDEDFVRFALRLFLAAPALLLL